GRVEGDVERGEEAGGVLDESQERDALGESGLLHGLAYGGFKWSLAGEDEVKRPSLRGEPRGRLDHEAVPLHDPEPGEHADHRRLLVDAETPSERRGIRCRLEALAIRSSQEGDHAVSGDQACRSALPG